jgi:hypothetical protein
VNSTINIGSGTTVAVASGIAAPAQAQPVSPSSIIGGGAIDFGSGSQTIAVDDVDANPTDIDLLIGTGINAAGAVVTKTGAGRLDLAPPAGSTVGLNIAAGNVQVDTGVGNVQLTGGTLSGLGTVGTIGTAVAPANGSISPGSTVSPAGTLTSGPGFWGSQTTFVVDLAAGNSDTLAVNGDLNINGATLVANFGSGINVGDTFVIIQETGTGTISGTFTSNDVVFASGQKFTIAYSPSQVTVTRVLADATIALAPVPAPNPATLNQPVTLTATVTPQGGASIIPGTVPVTFNLNGTPIGSAFVGPAGVATLTTTFPAAGTFDITATFDPNQIAFNTVTSSPVSQTVEAPTLDPLAGSQAFISPAVSIGTQDSITFTTTAHSERGNITNYFVEIDGNGITVKVPVPGGTGTPLGDNTFPISETWNGLEADGTTPAPDGSYTAFASVTDAFGNTFTSATTSFTVDNTLPTATAAVTQNVLDPTGKSNLPTTTHITGTVADTNLTGWEVDITNAVTGTPLRVFTGSGSTVGFDWNGKYDPAVLNPSPTDPNLVVAPDGAYTVTVVGLDSGGNRGASTSQGVVLLANGPTLTLGPPTSTVYGQSFTITVTASLPGGSLPLFQPLEAPLTGGTVEIFEGPVGAGTLVGTKTLSAGAFQASVTLPPQNAGSPSFYAVYEHLVPSDFPTATSAPFAHVITKAPISVAANPATKVYGAAAPTLTFAVSGLVNGDTAAGVFGSSTLGTTVTPASPVGTYPNAITNTLVPNGNYQVTGFTSANVVVTKAPLTISANNATRVIGQANPPFTFSVQGLANGDSQASVVGTVTLDTTATPASPIGSYPITVTNATLLSNNYSIGSEPEGTLSVTPQLLPETTFAIGTGAGGIATVSMFGPSGNLIKTLTPFGSFFGGVRTVTADFNGDGVDDLAVGTGPGVAAQVTVLSGTNGAPLFTTFPFDTFQGGVFLAAGDITGDGKAELVVTPDQGGGPRVNIYSGGSFAQMVSYFGINAPDFRGGARAAVGDMNDDGFADVAVSAGFAGGPRVSLWDGKALANLQFHNLVSDFFVFDPVLRNGSYVAIGDVNGDGFGDLIAGAGPGGGPQVKIFSGKDLLNPAIGPASTVPFVNFFAGDPNNRGGVRVAAKTFDQDQFADLLTGVGDGGGDTATAYLGVNLKNGNFDPFLAEDPFPGINTNGVFVG